MHQTLSSYRCRMFARGLTDASTEVDACEGQAGRLQNRSVPGAYRGSRGRNLEPATLRGRWILWAPASLPAIKDELGGGGLADESVDAAALDETLCERPLRRLLQRVGVLAGALLVLAAGEAG